MQARRVRRKAVEAGRSCALNPEAARDPKLRCVKLPRRCLERCAGAVPVLRRRFSRHCRARVASRPHGNKGGEGREGHGVRVRV
eukprot:3409673-Pleurochrysis_carterae.AAC.1